MGELANHLHGVDNAASRRKVTRMLRRRAVSYTHLTLPTNREV